jgi:hypothetical protein
MTTIAIASTATQCVIASESGITDDSYVTCPPMHKIIRQGDWLIAAAGSDRVCDTLQYITKYPVIPPALKTKTDDSVRRSLQLETFFENENHYRIGLFYE